MYAIWLLLIACLFSLLWLLLGLGLAGAGTWIRLSICACICLESSRVDGFWFLNLTCFSVCFCILACFWSVCSRIMLPWVGNWMFAWAIGSCIGCCYCELWCESAVCASWWDSLGSLSSFRTVCSEEAPSGVKRPATSLASTAASLVPWVPLKGIFLYCRRVEAFICVVDRLLLGLNALSNKET